MSSYSPIVNYASKDGLASGDPLKRIKGTEITAELNAISAAIASKADLVSPVFTGTPSAPTAAAGTNTTQLATTAFSYLSIANLITGVTGVNGWILSAANTPALYSNSAQRATINSTGNWVINVPSAGGTLALNQIAGQVGLSLSDGTASQVGYTNGAAGTFFGTQSNHPLTLFTNNLSRLAFTAGGAATFSSPVSGATVTATSNLFTPGSNTTSAFLATGNFGGGYVMQDGAGFAGIWTDTSGTFLRIGLGTSSALNSKMSISSTGNVNVSAPTSGVALTLNGVAGSSLLKLTPAAATNWLDVNDGTTNFFGTISGTNTFLGNASNHAVIIRTNNTDRVTIAAAGNVTFAAPASGVGVTVAGVSGTHSTKIADSATNSFNAGYLEVPQNVQNANYTTVLADSGKHIYHTSGSAHTYTIDSNANVAYPIGTTLTFVNENAGGIVTIAITSDTMRLTPGGTTGSRSLAANGRATALKVTATLWQIAGTGLT